MTHRQVSTIRIHVYYCDGTRSPKNHNMNGLLGRDSIIVCIYIYIWMDPLCTASATICNLLRNTAAGESQGSSRQPHQQDLQAKLKTLSRSSYFELSPNFKPKPHNS